MAEHQDKCPLCGCDATIREGPNGFDGKGVDCALCTQYKILAHAIIGLKPRDKELLPYLICHIRQTNITSVGFIIADNTWRTFAQSHKDTVFSQKVEKLLHLLAIRSNFQLGSRIRVDAKLDWPLVDAASEIELNYLLEFLLDEGYVNKKFEPQFQLTAKTWERFERAGAGQGVPGRCFVAMWFDPTMDDAFTKGIEPAVKSDCKMDPRRIDKEHHNEKICDKIIAEIRTCQFVVADVTMQRAGVYFEAGFAMGLGRPVIWSCRDDDLKNVHFDTRQYNHIVWKEPADLREKLADRIKATIPGAV